MHSVRVPLLLPVQLTLGVGSSVARVQGAKLDEKPADALRAGVAVLVGDAEGDGVACAPRVGVGVGVGAPVPVALPLGVDITVELRVGVALLLGLGVPLGASDGLAPV